MAFPVVQTADTKSGTVTSNSASWTLTYPTNIAAGDLLLACLATDGWANNFSFPAGWKGAATTDYSAVTLLYAKKAATGSETGNFSVGLGASEQGGWRVFRITGWGGTLGTEWSPLSGAAAGDVHKSNGVSTGTSTTPNPPSLDPANWDAEDTLWVAMCAVDTSRTVSAFPSDYTLNQSSDVSGGAGGATLGIAMRELNASSEDPGTFTISNSDDWAAETIAIRPATVVDLGPNPWDNLGIPIL